MINIYRKTINYINLPQLTDQERNEFESLRGFIIANKQHISFSKQKFIPFCNASFDCVYVIDLPKFKILTSEFSILTKTNLTFGEDGVNKNKYYSFLALLPDNTNVVLENKKRARLLFNTMKNNFDKKNGIHNGRINIADYINTFKSEYIKDSNHKEK